MTSAKYDYGLTDCIIWIIDHDTGSKSVTNDIENVIIDICNKESDLELAITPVIYRDSQGIWDGWDPKSRNFVSLDARTREEATRKMRDYFFNQQNY